MKCLLILDLLLISVNSLIADNCDGGISVVTSSNTAKSCQTVIEVNFTGRAGLHVDIMTDSRPDSIEFYGQDPIGTTRNSSDGISAKLSSRTNDSTVVRIYVPPLLNETKELMITDNESGKKCNVLIYPNATSKLNIFQLPLLL